MNKKNVLIVGGAGYIGSHTNLYLNESGYRTVVFDNLVYGHESSVICGEFVRGDLNDISQIEAVFDQYDISCVMHFAAYAYVGESVVDPQKYYENNVGATLNLLATMRKHHVTDIVFSSSCATYGVPSQLPITEDHLQEPINPYGASKMMVERILDDYSRAYGFRAVVLRYFNAAGADPKSRIGEHHDPETHLIPLVLEAAASGSSINIFGSDYSTADGTCIRDYIHVNDLASAHKLAMEYIKHSGKTAIFNLGSQHGFSVKEVIRVAEAVTGKPIDTLLCERRAGDPDVLIASADLARSELGWSPQYNTLDSIIDTAWKWFCKMEKRPAHVDGYGRIRNTI